MTKLFNTGSYFNRKKSMVVACVVAMALTLLVAPTSKADNPLHDAAPDTTGGRTRIAPMQNSEPVQSSHQSADSMPVLRGLSSLNSKSEQSDNSVESFFQISTRASDKPKKSQRGASLIFAAKTTGNILFNILDFAGVPMFFQKGTDLDPSLSKSGIILSPNKRRRTIDTAGPGIEQAQSGTPAGIAEDGRSHKIPQSELEGTIYEPQAKDNNQQTK